MRIFDFVFKSQKNSIWIFAHKNNLKNCDFTQFYKSYLNRIFMIFWQHFFFRFCVDIFIWILAQFLEINSATMCHYWRAVNESFRVLTCLAPRLLHSNLKTPFTKLQKWKMMTFCLIVSENKIVVGFPSLHLNDISGRRQAWDYTI